MKSLIKDNDIYIEGMRNHISMDVVKPNVYLFTGRVLTWIKESKCGLNIERILEISEEPGLYSSFVAYGEKIVFVPNSAEQILVYGLYDGKKEYIDIPVTSITYDKDKKFGNIYREGDFLFLIPNRYPGIVCLDMEKRKCIALTEWFQTFSLNMNYPGDCLLSNGCCRKDKKIYIPSCQNNSVIAIDTKTLRTESIQIGSDNAFFDDICFDGMDFWISGEKSVVRWREEDGILEEIVFPDDFRVKGDGCRFSDCVAYNGEVLLFPHYSNMFIRLVHNVQGTKMKYKILPEFTIRRFLVSDSGTYLYIYDNAENKLICCTEDGKKYEYMNRLLDFINCIIGG